MDQRECYQHYYQQIRLHDKTLVTFHEMFEVTFTKTIHHRAASLRVLFFIAILFLRVVTPVRQLYNSESIMVVIDSKVSVFIRFNRLNDVFPTTDIDFSVNGQTFPSKISTENNYSLTLYPGRWHRIETLLRPGCQNAQSLVNWWHIM